MGTIKGIDTVEDLKRWLPNASIGDSPIVPIRNARSKDLVCPSVSVQGGVFVALLPIVTKSEANESAWVKKMSRKASAKKTVREVLGPSWHLLKLFTAAYHNGNAIRAKFVRLGGRKVDPCNLSTTMKSVEDMIAGAMLADDGDPRWHVSYEQEPDSDLAGVRVELCVLT